MIKFWNEVYTRVVDELRWISCLARARGDYSLARQIERFEKVTGFKW